MKKQTKTYYGPYELTDHPRVQFVVTRSEGHNTYISTYKHMHSQRPAV